MITLLCHGSRPLGKNPVIITELGFLKVFNGQTFEVVDMTFANNLMAAYPGCFSLVKKLEEKIPEEKQKPQSKNKMKLESKNKDMEDFI